MDYLYGKLNNKVSSFDYEGIKSTTAEVIVDNNTRKITVNVLTDDASSVASKDFVNTFAKKIKSKIEESETGKYNLTLNLLDANNNVLDTSIVELPEGGNGDDIVSGSYDSETEYITLVKKSGNKVEIDLSSIVTDITALQNDYTELNAKVTNLDERITASTSLVNYISADLSAHKENKDNPHAVTKEQIGLDKVDNTADLDKPVSTATQKAMADIQNTVDGQISTINNEINSITSNITNLQTAVNDLQASSTEAINTVKINDVEIAKENKAINIATDKVSILYDNSKLHLPDAWITYLQKQTFAIPAITLGGISSRSVEWGDNVSVAANTITHRETNIDNIKANTLKLYRNNVSVADLTPNTSATAVDYEINEAITNSVSFIVKCTDAMNNTRQSSTVTYSAYKPCYYGALDASSITSVDGLTKKASESLGTVTFTSTFGQYGYLVTAGNITSVTSTGFAVPVEKMQDITVTLNNLSVTYHVWRTATSLDAGSNTFVVA